MSTQEINYTQGSDTGERDPASVAPINPGEKVKSVIFDRPIENLRNRSEVLRDEVIDQKYLQDTDIMWLIADGDAVTGLNPGMDLPMILWDPDGGGPGLGKFSIGPFGGVSMVLQPIKTPGYDTETSGGEDVVYTFVADTITITSFLRNYAGGNRREVRWVWDTGITGTALAFLSGSPNHILTIHVASDGTTQVTDVDNALLALGASLGAAGFAHGVTGGGDLIAVVPTDHVFEKIHEREMHRIPQSQFAAFFDLMGMNKSLVDGDTLAIAYDVMTELSPGIGGRRQSCPTNGNISITAGQLFITTENPEKIPIGIPICKRIGNDLIFLDGTVCYGNAPGGPYPLYVGEHGYTVNRILTAASWVEATITSQWYGPLALSGGPFWTIDSALNNIIGDLATVGAPSGAQRIGMAPTAAANTSLGFYNVPALGDSIASTLLALITLLNTKASLGFGAAFDTEEVITGRWKFNNHVRLGQDKAVLRDAPADVAWHLVYRNNRGVGQSEVNSEITWGTYSVYELVNDPVLYSSSIEVFGGYMSSGTTVTTPSVGTGDVFFIRSRNRSGGSGTYTMGYRTGVAGATALNIFDAAAWDYYDSMSAGGGQLYRDFQGGDGTLGRPLAHHRMRIPQDFLNDVDFENQGSSFGQCARIQVVSRPWSYAMEGLWAQPESLDPLSDWTPDAIMLSAGRVLVNGRPFCRTTRALVTNLSTRLMGDGTVVLPTVADDDGASGKIPAWYYLWMRRDGNLFIGQQIPQIDWMSNEPGIVLYRPALSEVHLIAGYTQADYTLLDVVCLMQVYDPGSGPQYYWDCAPLVGGSERRLLARRLPSTLAVMSRELVHDTVDSGGLYVPTPLQQNGTLDAPPDPQRRTPGIPIGVSKKVKIGYKIGAFYDGNASNQVGLRIRLAETELLHALFEPCPLPANPEYEFYILQSSGAAGMYHQAGAIDVALTYTATPGISYQVVRDGGTSVDIRLYLLGFHWNRREGLQ